MRADVRVGNEKPVNVIVWVDALTLAALSNSRAVVISPIRLSIVSLPGWSPRGPARLSVVRGYAPSDVPVSIVPSRAGEKEGLALPVESEWTASPHGTARA